LDPPPKVGSPEWQQQEEEEMLEAAVAQYHAGREAEAEAWGMTIEEYDLAEWFRDRRT
jgi:hypothetical protein